ncbi:reverse transcriptase [Trichonephila clavipes]|nr:reverse transcriptase [Trichonephila clavipes]
MGQLSHRIAAFGIRKTRDSTLKFPTPGNVMCEFTVAFILGIFFLRDSVNVGPSTCSVKGRMCLAADVCCACNYCKDSQAAVLALINITPIDCINTMQCRTKIAELFSYGWTVALQWVPSYVGIPGNERANQKAKQRAESTQLEVPLTLRRANSIISTCIGKYPAMTKNEEFWKAMGKPGNSGPNPDAPGESRDCCPHSPNYRT